MELTIKELKELIENLDDNKKVKMRFIYEPNGDHYLLDSQDDTNKSWLVEEYERTFGF